MARAKKKVKARMDHLCAVPDPTKDAQIELLSRQVAVLQEKLRAQEALTAANFGQHPAEIRVQQLELQVQVLQQENESLKKTLYADVLYPWNSVQSPTNVADSQPGDIKQIETSYQDFMNQISGRVPIPTHNVDSTPRPGLPCSPHVKLTG